MNLQASWNIEWREWHVIDQDTYDGAEDSHGSCRVIGRGQSEAEAIADWCEQQRAFADPREEREYAAECEMDKRRDDAMIERIERDSTP